MFYWGANLQIGADFAAETCFGGAHKFAQGCQRFVTPATFSAIGGRPLPCYATGCSCGYMVTMWCCLHAKVYLKKKAIGQLEEALHFFLELPNWAFYHNNFKLDTR